jgi:hypothetical protein
MLRYGARLLLAAGLALTGAMAASPTGVLLGRLVASKFRYQTLWVYDDGREVRIVSAPDLLIPRKQGFWRAGNYYTLDIGPEIEGPAPLPGRYMTEEEHVWALPVRQRPSAALKPEQRLIQPPAKEDTCEHTYRPINFVSTTHIWYETRSGYECGIHPDGESEMHVASLDTLETERIDISAMLGETGVDAFRRAIVTAFEEARKEAGFECEPIQDLANWTIVRGPGRWMAAGWATTHRLCGYGLSLEIPVSLPQTLTGHDRLLKPWGELRAEIPDLIDAFSSPQDTLLVAITKEAILAYRPASGKLGPPVLRYPLRWRPDGDLGDKIVMAQWATGVQNVARWTNQVNSLREIRPIVQRK